MAKYKLLRDRRVFDWAWQRRMPLAFCMAGGYGVKIDETVRMPVNTYRVAFEYWLKWAQADGKIKGHDAITAPPT